MTQLSVTEITIYPVKSLRGINLSSTLIERRGPRYDRHWMVIDAHHNFLTQRQIPRMSLIDVQLTESMLILSHADNSVEISLQTPTLPAIEVNVWNDCVAATDMGDEAAEWLSQLLKQPCRLVAMQQGYERQVDLNYAAAGDIVGFADGFASLLISEASLADFNTHLAKKITMRHFRPNIVVAGCEPYAEDKWKKIRIGSIEFDVVKPCSRCAIPTINPDTAQRSPAIWQALTQQRERDGRVFFGQNLVHKQVGEIKLGDKIELLC